ncbi:hypothetical protein BV898_10497 [Hypsibius exemplaris]|uniref:Uncharacterized protein n=1 Tax=Hypsibius exemplaris TaxID=2072580 RepID=A0A1W0WJG2_HYPEX|nr:hypothetical protein BV898_10497 [Hypsibius exemplaris]
MVMVTSPIVATIVILNVHVGFESALPTKFIIPPLVSNLFAVPKSSNSSHAAVGSPSLHQASTETPVCRTTTPVFLSSPSHRNKGGLYYHKVNQNQIELQQFRTRSRAADRRPLLTTTTATRPDVLDFEERRYQVFRRTDIRKVVDGSTSSPTILKRPPTLGL